MRQAFCSPVSVGGCFTSHCLWKCTTRQHIKVAAVFDAFHYGFPLIPTAPILECNLNVNLPVVLRDAVALQALCALEARPHSVLAFGTLHILSRAHGQ